MKKVVLSLVMGIPLLFVILVAVFPAPMGGWVYDSSMAAEASIYGFSKQNIPINEMNLSVYQNNTVPNADKQTIVMLHGYSADKSVWLRFANALGDDFNIIIPDLAGHGETGFEPTWDYSGPAQAARVLALMDQLQVQQAHIIGNSMGGFIAAHFAHLYPQRTLTSTLVDPAGVVSPELSEMGKMLAQGKNPFIVNSTEEFFDFYDMTMAQPPFVPDFVKAGVGERYQNRKEELADIYDDIHGVDLLDEHLSAINTPILIMWGAKDELIHVSSAKVWDEGLPNSELKVWPEIGHMPMVEIPQESASIYREFLSKH